MHNESHADLCCPTLSHSMLPVYFGSWEPSRTVMYRQVIIASHRYAFPMPAIALVGQFIGAVILLE
jgi:hypothetical protein